MPCYPGPVLTVTPQLHLSYTSVTPQLYLSYTSVTPQLYLQPGTAHINCDIDRYNQITTLLIGQEGRNNCRS